MIRSFRHDGLEELFLTGSSRKVRTDLAKRCIRRLDTIDHAKSFIEFNVSGYDFHALRGSTQRYTIHVNGPWCITFEWRDGHAWNVDLEQYH